MVLLLQATHLANYGSKSTNHLDLLKMMSGNKPPSEFGLDNKRDIVILVRLSKLLVLMRRANLPFVILSSGAFELLPYALHAPAMVTMTYGVANTALMIASNYHIYNAISFHSLYFYIVCKYLNSKTKNLIQNLSKISKTDDISRLASTYHSISSLFAEINAMNRKFWSKFLFNVWLTFGSVVVILIYIGAFGSLELYMTLIIDYVIVSFALFFTFVFFMSAAVNSNVNRMNHAFHKLSCHFSKSIRHKPGEFRLIYKVIDLIHIFY